MQTLMILASLVAVSRAGLTTPQLIQTAGYGFENVTVETEDGYILTMHHITRGRRNCDHVSSNQKPVVFLQHGLEATSSNWVAGTNTSSLGFLLADACFDVWMGNVRGNVYSRQHTSRVNDSSYWSFSWEQMARYDLPAMINKALERTQKKNLYYVGHSQGTLIMFAKLASDTAFGKKIRKFFALAPIGTVRHIHWAAETFMKVFNEICQRKRLYEKQSVFPPLSDNTFASSIKDWICSHRKGKKICKYVVNFVSGNYFSTSNQLDAGGENAGRKMLSERYAVLCLMAYKERIKNYIGDMPGGTSYENMCHWAQMVSEDEPTVRGFDWGSESQNMLHHGQPTPHVYDYSKIQVMTYLYWSDKDKLADEEDIREYIRAKYNRNYLEEKYKKEFTHADFIWGSKAAHEIYSEIESAIETDSNIPTLPGSRVVLHSSEGETALGPEIVLEHETEGNEIHLDSDSDDLHLF